MKEFPAAALKGALRIVEGYEGIGGQKGNLFYPYHCKADKPGVMTLFKGHMLSDSQLKNGMMIGGKLVQVKNGITREQGEQLYMQDVMPRAKAVLDLVPNATDIQYAAILSFFFNNEYAWGPKGTPGNLHRARKHQESALSFFLYNKSGDPLLPRLGLWRRRGTEALYYLTGELIIAKEEVNEKRLFKRLAELDIKPTPPPKFY